MRLFHLEVDTLHGISVRSAHNETVVPTPSDTTCLTWALRASPAFVSYSTASNIVDWTVERRNSTLRSLDVNPEVNTIVHHNFGADRRAGVLRKTQRRPGALGV